VNVCHPPSKINVAAEAGIAGKMAMRPVIKAIAENRCMKTSPSLLSLALSTAATIRHAFQIME
jgi:hypothetical protein